MVKHLPLPSKRTIWIFVVTCFLLVTFLLPNGCFAANYDYTYELLDSPGGSTVYQLTVSVTSSLYEYYSSKDHIATSPYDSAKFVTPTALKPIADDLWSIYSDDEDFANGALILFIKFHTTRVDLKSTLLKQSWKMKGIATYFAS